MPNEATSHKNWFARHKVVTGIIGFILFSMLVAAMSTEEQKTATQESGVPDAISTAATTETAPENHVVSIGLNEPMDLHTYTLTVLGSRETTTLSAKYGESKSAKKGAKFVILEVEVTAQTATEFLYFPDRSIELFDGSRYFKEYNDTIGAIDNYITVRTLSPGITETGVLVYEIPETEDVYALFGTNEQTEVRYLIALPQPKAN